MSLQTRLTALAQAIGADIKALNAKMASDAAAFQLGGGPATGSSSAGGSAVLALAPVIREDPVGFFTRNADQSVSVKDAGWYTISATAGSNVALAAGSEIGANITKNGAEIAFPIVEASWYGRVNVSASMYLVPTDRVAIQVWSQVAVTTWSMNALSIVRVGGPKGDPGGVNVVTTLDWNTATAPNFYRSSSDPMQQTRNGPGDTLNPPSQAGIVSVHETGALVQRVWDLDYKVGYSRYRSGGGVWSAWVAELGQLPVWAEQMVGAPIPQDGDERYFQSAAMKAAGVMWRFRYDKTAPAGQPKWVFVGGSEWWAGETAAATVNTSTYGLFNGPQLVVPLAGDYMVRYGAAMAMVLGENGYYTALTATGNANDTDAVNAYSSSGNPYFNVARQRPATIASGFTVQGVSRVSGPGRMFTARWLSISPIRVVM